MAWTATTLKTALRDYMETDEPTFVANLDIIIKQAEDRILKNVQLPNFSKTSNPTITAGSPTVTVPSDWLSTQHFNIDNSGIEFLIYKDVSFVREAYPDSTVEGTPRYYALVTDTQFLLGPTPDSNYTSELRYFYRPTSIVDGSTSWLGTHAESTLLYGCLVEAYTFLKGDADLLQLYDSRYKESLQELKLLGEGRMKVDQYRSGF